MEREIISLFKRYNLVMNIETDVTQAEARIIIYPSIFMAVGTDDINEYYKSIQDKVKAYAGGDEDGDYDEAIDQNSID